jgi:hypothetical protein
MSMSEQNTNDAGNVSDDMNKIPAGSVPDLERRQFVTHAAATAAGAATLGFPMIARAAEPITLKFQTTWLVDDIFYEYARDYGRLVNDMSGGRSG